jgi:hypothetical protein
MQEREKNEETVFALKNNHSFRAVPFRSVSIQQNPLHTPGINKYIQDFRTTKEKVTDSFIHSFAFHDNSLLLPFIPKTLKRFKIISPDKGNLPSRSEGKRSEGKRSEGKAILSHHITSHHITTMASNNLRKRRSRLSTPIETKATPSAVTNNPSDIPSPSKKAKRSTSFTTNRSKMGSIPEAAAACSKNEYCGLGLQRILGDDTLPKASPSQQLQEQKQQQQRLGPVIPLCPKMYLGRTPPSVLKAMASFKPLGATWSAEDFSSFSQKHQKVAGEYALLGIECKVAQLKSQSSKDEQVLLSVSRKLLRVVKYNNDNNNNNNNNNNDNNDSSASSSSSTATTTTTSTRSITLQRCAEAQKPDGRPARQVNVMVYRRPLLLPKQACIGIENENNSNSSESTNKSNGNIPNRKTKNGSNSSGSDVVRVQPNSKVVLREGDTLMILNEKYRYRVVAIEAEVVAGAGNPKEKSTGTAQAKSVMAMDLAASSSSSGSGSSSSIPSSPVKAMGTTTRRSLPRRNRTRTSRASMSSVNDRTVALRDDEDDEMDVEHENKHEIIQILSSNSEDSGQKQKSRTDKTIDLTPSKAKPARGNYKYETPDNNFKTPDCKPKEIINLAESSNSNSSSSNSNSESCSASKNNHTAEKTNSSEGKVDKCADPGNAKPNKNFDNHQSHANAKSRAREAHYRQRTLVKEMTELEKTNAYLETKETEVTTLDEHKGSSSSDSSSSSSSKQSHGSSCKTTSNVDIGNATEENQPIDVANRSSSNINSEIKNNDNATKCNNTENAKIKTNTNKNDPTAKSHNASSHRHNTRHNTRSSIRLLPRAPDAQSSNIGFDNEKEQSPTSGSGSGSSKKTDIDDLGNRLRQKGLRIKYVLLREEKEEGIVVEIPIHEVMCTKKNLHKGPVKEEPIEATNKADATSGTILSLESPTRRFWDPSWNGDAGKADPTIVTPTRNDVTSTTEATNSVETSPNNAPPPSAMVSLFRPPGDMPASMANFYWNALSSSRPREGAWYLNASIMAANTVPGPLLCGKWMTLLTWGPRLITEAPSSSKRKATKRNFSWDGPRIDFALELWKKALGLHPRILLPRMIGVAPGGPSEWWKTCLSYDELSEEPEEDHTREGLVRQNNINSNGNGDDSAGAIEAAHKAIRCLRMRSARLEAFLHLLKWNLAFEEEQQHEKIQAQKEQYKKNQSTPQHAATERNGDDSDKDDDDCSSDEEDADDSAEDDGCLKSLVLLREIRSFGAKPVLRLVAQAMSKFWVSQKHYLGYSGDSDTTSMLLGQEEDPSVWSEHWSLEQERSDVVEEVATQLAEVLVVMRKIMESSHNATNPETSPLEGRCRRSRRRRFLDESSSSKLSNKEIGDLLWNAMDLEVRERLPKPKKQKRKPSSDESYVEPAPREAFLVDWLWVLKESMGNEFAMELAEKVGVDEHYDALWDL